MSTLPTNRVLISLRVGNEQMNFNEKEAPAPILITRAKFTREWFVLEHGKMICSLIEYREPGQRLNGYRLRSPSGDWTIQVAKKWSRYAAQLADDPSKVAEIRTGVVPVSFGEVQPDEFIYDLYIDLFAYRRTELGHRWRVKLKGELVLDYGKPWKDSDRERRICYQIWPKIEIDPRHRDLLLVMPLFWTGMNMYEPA